MKVHFNVYVRGNSNFLISPFQCVRPNIMQLTSINKLFELDVNVDPRYHFLRHLFITCLRCVNLTHYCTFHISFHRSHPRLFTNTIIFFHLSMHGNESFPLLFSCPFPRLITSAHRVRERFSPFIPIFQYTEFALGMGRFGFASEGIRWKESESLCTSWEDTGLKDIRKSLACWQFGLWCRDSKA